MEITSFVVQGRDKALLYGDYSTYHAQLAKRLLNSRKKLGIATRNRGKFHKKAQVTPEEIAENQEYVRLSLLTSERAWAQAMSMKAAHTNDQKGIVSRTRTHIVSRLHKAALHADQLVEALSQADVSNASKADILESKGYAAMLHGATLFEKQSWELCLRHYSVARVVYGSLATATKVDIYNDLISETIDPSIRYAAYRLKTPRTIPIPVIAKQAFPTSDEDLVSDINKFDPDALTGEPEGAKGALAEGVPRTLIWRSREVTIEDAQIAVAWGAVQNAKISLSKRHDSLDHSDPSEVAAVYDEILMTTQDAVDATKTAIDELRNEGVGQSDPRMQSLQITRTAVNYEMISWRIGRNRVLTGPHDGATEDYHIPKRRRKAVKIRSQITDAKELPVSRKLAKLKEKAALYDGTLQNLQSIKELPGVAADEVLAAKLEASVSYFESLTALAIARSHALIGNVGNALALVQHALDLSQEASIDLPASGNSPLNVDLTNDDVKFLTNLLDGELQRHRAIVHIDNIRKDATENTLSTNLPLIERLNEYPTSVLDLANIVEFPPKKAVIPVKPIFLDVAWNYIDYPNKPTKAPPAAAQDTTDQPAGEAKEQPAKRGWFGFGRS